MINKKLIFQYFIYLPVMLRKLIILLVGILCLYSSKLYASHAAGMDIKYEYLGPSGSNYQYRITVYFYRPCDNLATHIAAPGSLPIRYRCGGGGTVKRRHHGGSGIRLCCNR